MQNNFGFLKRSQEFRKNITYGKYFPILDCLYSVSTKHHNNLPTLFSLNNLYGFSEEDVAFTLSILYPERSYSCTFTSEDTIYCVSS